MRREDQNTLSTYEVSIFKNKLVLQQTDKEKNVSEINFQELQVVEFDKFQPGTVILQTDLMKYYLHCKTKKNAELLVQILQEKFINFQKIMLSNTIKQLTEEASVKQMQGILNFSLMQNHEILEKQKIQKYYIEAIKQEKPHLTQELNLCLEFLQAFNKYETEHMNQLIEELIDSNVLNIKKILMQKQRKSLKMTLNEIMMESENEIVTHANIQTSVRNLAIANEPVYDNGTSDDTETYIQLLK